MRFKKGDEYNAKKILPELLDKDPICFKGFEGQREAIKAIPGWQGKLRAIIARLIDSFKKGKVMDFLVIQGSESVSFSRGDEVGVVHYDGKVDVPDRWRSKYTVNEKVICNTIDFEKSIVPSSKCSVQIGDERVSVFLGINEGVPCVIVAFDSDWSSLLVDISLNTWKEVKISQDLCISIGRAIKFRDEYSILISQLYSGGKTQALARLQALSKIEGSLFLERIAS